MPVWVLFSLMSNAAIQWVEYLNRTSTAAGFVQQLTWTWPLILVAQWGLFETWRGAPHVLAAWLVFTVGNCVMRLLMSRFILGESFQWWGLLGVAGMMASAWVVKEALSYGGVR
jgi:hypothetical protein